VKHITGIPHLSTGQAIVERANRTLKEYLQKQKDKEVLDLQTRLSKVLLTLNLLSLSHDAEQTPVQLHFTSQKIDPMPEVSVHYKDPATGQWVGP
ncbi:POK19 protein, partial [Sakesphorus luctuosus]|nr:POK19 protein [Sakesphorus luctuosus]